jgi:predicted PurR-regulated permease PerM
MPLEEAKLVSTSSTSGRIIAAGIVIAFCYWAASVLVTLLVAVLLAYFLDPVVTFMEEWHIPRALGSLLVVLFTIAVMLLLTVFLIERADQFGADWPQYREPLHKIASTVQQKMSTFEEHVSEIGPSQVPVPGQTIVTVEPHPIRAAVIARLSSVYEIILLPAALRSKKP